MANLLQSSLFSSVSDEIGVTPKDDKRYRKQYRFWLDLQDADEYDLARGCDDLQAARLFAKTIRSGLRLMLDLYHGQTAVLVSLFPWVRAHFADQETKQLIAQLTSTIDDLRRDLAQARTSQPAPVAYNARPVNAAPAADFSDLLQVSAAQPTAHKYNVVHCNLQLGLYQLGSIKSLRDLDSEVLEYGLSIGKLPPAAQQLLDERRQRAGASSPVPALLPPTVGNAKAMDVPQFQVDIPDEELDGLL